MKQFRRYIEKGDSKGEFLKNGRRKRPQYKNGLARSSNRFNIQCDASGVMVPIFYMEKPQNYRLPG